MEIKLHLVDEIGRNVSLCKGGDVAKFVGSVVRRQHLHLDILRVNAEAISETLGQVSKNLADCGRAVGNEAIV